ncbi:MAG TPA: CopG family transcriptional regulator [Candidatus Tectomicrobia bacterium]|nr:CopG family transcriptional regulator [Candidatus Tectomicrobia bacterium]
MMQDEREDYGAEAQDVIEGLRRLARHVETPSDLASTILARGEQLLSPRKQQRSPWWTIVAAWRPHPLAWGPIVAVTCFIAGVLVPWPRTDMLLQDVVSRERAASVTPLSHKESTEVSATAPATPSQTFRDEMRQQIEPAPAAPEPFRALAPRAPMPVSSSRQINVTATLPAELYEHLQQEARRRRVSVATILREAVEAYAQSPRGEE